MAMGLGTTRQRVSQLPEDVNRRLKELSEEVSSISRDLHTLSHRLHSASLESLGLVRGLSALCKEFSIQQTIEVEFTHDETPQAIHPDLALCVFRITQEALRNVKKHSGASSAWVDLKLIEGRIHLLVKDEGRGFDPKDLKSHEGLGLRSMAERARFMGGRLEIHSSRKGHDGRRFPADKAKRSIILGRMSGVPC